MAEIKKLEATVTARAVLVLSEVELRALDALAGYGADRFIENFYKVMGRSYLEPYEAGLRSFLETVQGCAGFARDAEECRELLAQAKAERMGAQKSPRSGFGVIETR